MALPTTRAPSGVTARATSVCVNLDLRRRSSDGPSTQLWVSQPLKKHSTRMSPWPGCGSSGRTTTSRTHVMEQSSTNTNMDAHVANATNTDEDEP